jgi:pyruvate,orthophosphate dikinase
MVAAKAILTARGGMTIHAPVVARGIGKPCVASAQKLEVNEQNLQFSVNGRTIKQGEWITIDGGSGGSTPDRRTWFRPSCRAISPGSCCGRQGPPLRVRVNADTPADAARAATSAPRASGSAVPSTCSSRATG